MKKIYIILPLLLCLGGWMNSLQAQSVALHLEGQLDCQAKTYCVTIQVKRDTGSTKLRLGTSSIWLDYNSDALAFRNYNSSGFNEKTICTTTNTTWAAHSYDAESMPGVFHLTIDQLNSSRSCPRMNSTNWEDIGVICFDITKQGANPDVSIDLLNTFFNRHRPNDGTDMAPLTQTDSICQSGLLACDCPGPSLPCNDNNVYTVNDRFDEYCECNGELLDTDKDGIYDGVDPCLDLMYEAEEASPSTGAEIKTNHPQYSGTGFIDFPYGNNQNIEFEFSVQQAGSFLLSMNYALGNTTSRPMEVSIDSVLVISSLDFPYTGSWASWDTVSFTQNLTAGTHKVNFKTLTNPGAANLDYLMVSQCTNCTQSGQTCDDLDPCTTGDIYDANCNCAGVQMDSDKDGVCDVNDICPGGDDLVDSDSDNIPDACDDCDNRLVGTACDDNNPCTINDTYDANCNCIGTSTGSDSDNDGVCDAYDLCPGGDDFADIDGDGIPDFCDTCDDRTIGKPCDDGNPCTILDRVTPGCGCVGIPMDDDNDGSCNWEDQCPNFDNRLIGTACDDGDPNTINDVYTSYCTCAGEAPTPCIATGELRYEIWKNVSGVRISDLQNASNYPSLPDSVIILDQFVQGLTNYGSDYGSRISGLLCPPQTGYYTFMVSGDDYSQLWLSSDESRDNLVPIAYLNGWTKVGQWDKYSTQNSDSVAGPLYLIKGKSYFFQAYHKEGSGGDHFAMRWIRPDGTDEAPVPASYFSLAPAQVSIKHDDISCFGLTDGEMTAVPSHGTTPYSYLWSDGSTTQTITGLQAGTYSVTITDATGQTASRSATIDEPPLLSSSVVKTDVSCYGGSDGSIELTASGGTPPIKVKWNRGQGSSFFIDSLYVTNYYATVTDANGCKVTSNTYINQPDPISILTEIHPSTHQDGQLYVEGQGGTAPYTYLWSDGSTHQRKFGLSTGSYPVTVTDANGCEYTQSVDVAAPPKMETGTIQAGDSWQTINLAKSYTSPIVVTTLHLDSIQMPPAVTRIRNAGSNSFDMRIQGTNGYTYHQYRVEYWVVEEGVYTDANGLVMEAVKATSDKTAHKVNWQREARSYQNTYSQPVVLGQVMTENDTSWSVFWASKNSSRSSPPTATNFAAGKHVGEDPDTTRQAESIGYIVLEAGVHRLSGMILEAGVGADVIVGVKSNHAGVSYPLEIGRADRAVVSSTGLDNGDGSWPVFMGENAIEGDQLWLGMEENMLNDRYHGTEQAAFVAFATDCPVAAGAYPAMEHGEVASASESWQTISLCHTYQSPVVVATPIIPDNIVNSVVTRIRNASGNSFELKVQHPGGATNLDYAVHYWVVEAGTYTEAENGINMEAQLVNSAVTSNKANWQLEPRSYQNSYQQPVVLGQVMSENNSDWSVFWASSASSRTRPPEAAGFAAGLHVGEDPNTNRSSEVLGIIVVEAGVYANNSQTMEAGLGADIVRGQQNSAVGYSYPLGISGAYHAAASVAAMDGADGGFPGLFGSNPVASSQLQLTFQEDRLTDTERSHTTEQVAYMAFGTDFNSGSRQGQYITESDDFDEENMLQSRFSLYPNPTYGKVLVEWWQAESETVNINLYDMMGKRVYQQSLADLDAGDQKLDLDLGTLSDGTYSLELTGKSFSISKKLVVIRP